MKYLQPRPYTVAHYKAALEDEIWLARADLADLADLHTWPADQDVADRERVLLEIITEAEAKLNDLAGRPDDELVLDPAPGC